MNSYWAITLTILALANLGVLIALLCRPKDSEALSNDLRRLEQNLPEQFRAQREESTRAAGELRKELNDSGTNARKEVRELLLLVQKTVTDSLRDSSHSQGKQLSEFSQTLERLQEMLRQHLDKIRTTVEGKFTEMQSKNEQKLEEMRRTVDEKLEATLERRLGESFKLVSERLEQVHRGLGEMQAMASSVGDLKRVLTNVKARGTWGEIQLGSLLEQILSPEQYAQNVTTIPGSSERVEFAIRLPGNNGETPVWLPIDAKFPQEDYQRLVDAIERADAEAVLEAGKALEICIRNQARTIRDKYVAVPHTTDFGILFLPSEGLYAEVMRRPGLSENLQRELRIMLAGPATLAALLNSLQMGFRTLAIQQRASEVWKVLGAIKTEFGKFGDILAKVKKKLEEASTEIEKTETRTRVITRTLREVEALPTDKTTDVLPQTLIADEEPEGSPPLRENQPSSQAQQNSLGL